MGKMDLNEKISLTSALIASVILVVVLYIAGKREFEPIYVMITMLSCVSVFSGWSMFFKARKMKNDKK